MPGSGWRAVENSLDNNHGVAKELNEDVVTLLMMILILSGTIDETCQETSLSHGK